MTSGRHASHSVYSRFNSGEKIGRSTNTQDALANVISRQPLVVAICSIAGNQCDACESPTSATVKEACEDDLSIACPVDAPLFKGGPCEGLLTVLHTREDVGDLEVMNGVYFTSRRESIESIMLNSGEEDLTSSDHPARFFVGYAGWSTGQLDAELQAGGWLTMPATREHIFSADSQEQWNKLITEVTLGKWVDPDQMPEDPTVN